MPHVSKKPGSISNEMKFLNKTNLCLIAVFIITSLISAVVNGLGDSEGIKIFSDILWVLSLSFILYFIFKELSISNHLFLLIALSWILRILLIPLDMVKGIARQPDQGKAININK